MYSTDLLRYEAERRRILSAHIPKLSNTPVIATKSIIRRKENRNRGTRMISSFGGVPSILSAASLGLPDAENEETEGAGKLKGPFLFLPEVSEDWVTLR
jgi:hypothetical protein